MTRLLNNYFYHDSLLNDNYIIRGTFSCYKSIKHDSDLLKRNCYNTNVFWPSYSEKRGTSCTKEKQVITEY